jgi:hypothetical protein
MRLYCLVNIYIIINDFNGLNFGPKILKRAFLGLECVKVCKPKLLTPPRTDESGHSLNREAKEELRKRHNNINLNQKEQ